MICQQTSHRQVEPTAVLYVFTCQYRAVDSQYEQNLTLVGPFICLFIFLAPTHRNWMYFCIYTMTDDALTDEVTYLVDVITYDLIEVEITK